MKLNTTTVLLFGILGLVAWKLMGGNQALLGAGGAAPNANPAGGVQTTAQPDLFTSIVNAAQSVFNSVTAIAQASSKTN